MSGKLGKLHMEAAADLTGTSNTFVKFGIVFASVNDIVVGGQIADHPALDVVLIIENDSNHHSLVVWFDRPGEETSRLMRRAQNRGCLSILMAKKGWENFETQQ